MLTFAKLTTSAARILFTPLIMVFIATAATGFSLTVDAKLPPAGEELCKADPTLPICPQPGDQKPQPGPAPMPNPRPRPTPTLPIPKYPVPVPAPAPGPGKPQQTMVKLTQTGPAGSRNFFVFAPAHLSTTEKVPLFVMLHGCTQTPQGFADASGMNAVAEKRGFIAIYPEQTSQYNSLSCWNWFSNDNLQQAGELQLIAMMVATTAAQYPVDLNKVYAVGFSAGAAMTSNILGCYGDVFSGGAIHSGLTFDAAENQNDAQAAMKNGTSHAIKDVAERAVKCGTRERRATRLMIIHGERDTTVAPVNATQIEETYKDVIDLSASSQIPLEWKQQSRTLPSQSGFQANVKDEIANGQIRIESVFIENMNHAWSGGNSRQPYTQPRSLDASMAIVNFLMDGKPIK